MDVEDCLQTPAHTATFDHTVFEDVDLGARDGSDMSDAKIKVETDIIVTESLRNSRR